VRFVDGFLGGGGVVVEGIFVLVDELYGVLELYNGCLLVIEAWRGIAGCFEVVSRY
jgi:hypothetical protein